MSSFPPPKWSIICCTSSGGSSQLAAQLEEAAAQLEEAGAKSRSPRTVSDEGFPWLVLCKGICLGNLLISVAVFMFLVFIFKENTEIWICFEDVAKREKPMQVVKSRFMNSMLSCGSRPTVSHDQGMHMASYDQ